MGKRMSIEDVQARADLIWKAYHENGDEITRAEITDLVGAGYYGTYQLFKRRGVSVPEPSDTTLGMLSKKADKLNATGKSILTSQEVADILGLDSASDSYGYYPQIAESFDVPKMVGVRQREDAKLPEYARDSFYERQSEGLQVMSRRDLGNGKAIYQVR